MMASTHHSRPIMKEHKHSITIKVEMPVLSLISAILETVNTIRKWHNLYIRLISTPYIHLSYTLPTSASNFLQGKVQ